MLILKVVFILFIAKSRFFFLPDKVPFTPSLDIIIVPLVAFDDTGIRIGFGSGIYDRSLPFFSDSKKIGLAFFDQLNKKRLPKEEFDYPLDAVITEKRVFIFDEEDEN